MLFLNLCGLGYAKMFTDQSGQSVEVKKPFTRIISLYGAHTENLFSLGLDKEIIGVSQNEVYPRKAMTKPDFSYHDDAEKFMAVRPDLVLIRPMIAISYESFVTRLRKAGITVVSLQPVSLDDMYEYWKILGLLTGKENRAYEMIRIFKNTMGKIESLAGTIPHEKRKRVYFEAIHEKMKTFSPDSMAIFALEKAGGINIAYDATPRRNSNIAVYGKERILARAAETDVYLAQNGRMNYGSAERIKQEPGFYTIKAVKNNQIHIIDELIVSRPTLRLARGAFEIGSALYPDVFTPDIWQEIRGTQYLFVDEEKPDRKLKPNKLGIVSPQF